MITDALATRTMSAFPLSIGTSIAFESIFEGMMSPYDTDRVIPDRVDINKYKYFYINLETLVRNILGSVKKEVFLLSKPQDLSDVLFNEVQIINSIMSNDGGKCIPVFYSSTYSKILNTNNKIIDIRKDNTDLQKTTTSKIDKTLDIFYKDYKNEGYLRIDSYPRCIEVAHGLILSHIAYDLLGYKTFYKLDLIESHTGKLKPRKLWYTKFYKMPVSDLSYIPFYKWSLVVFGDNIMFHPMSSKIRLDVLEVAKRGHWTHATTADKVRQDLNAYMRDIPLRNEILSI